MAESELHQNKSTLGTKTHLSNITCILPSLNCRYIICLCCCPSRWWRWRREWWRALALLLWLHHALPDCFLEGSVCVRSTHGVLERLGLLLCVHRVNRRVDRRHRRPGLPLRLHHWPEGHGYGCGLCGPRHLGTWWALFCGNESPGVIVTGVSGVTEWCPFLILFLYILQALIYFIVSSKQKWSGWFI